MRTLAVGIAAVALLLAFAPAVGASTRTTTLQDDFFTKKQLIVRPGTVVEWKWSTGEKHTVTDRKGKFTSHRTKHGDFRHRFRTKGTYRVFCRVHPATMMQRIVVR